MAIYSYNCSSLAFFGFLAKDLNFKEHPFYSVGIVLIISGTVGNFIDRIFRGYVVDFIQFAFWHLLLHSISLTCVLFVG